MYGTTVGHLFSKSKKSKLPPIFHQVLASISRGLSFARFASGTQALSRNNPNTPEAMNYSTCTAWYVPSNGNFSIYICTYIHSNGSTLNHRLQETLTYIPTRIVKFIDALEAGK